MTDTGQGKIAINVAFFWTLMVACATAVGVSAVQKSRVSDLQNDISSLQIELKGARSDANDKATQLAAAQSENDGLRGKLSGPKPLLNDPNADKQLGRFTSELNACQAQLSRSATDLIALKKTNNSVLAVQISQLEQKAGDEQVYMNRVTDSNREFSLKYFEENDSRYEFAKNAYEHDIADISTLRTTMKCAE